MKERTNRTRELQRWESGTTAPPSSSSSCLEHCRLRAADIDSDAHMQDVEDAQATTRFSLSPGEVRDRGEPTAAPAPSHERRTATDGVAVGGDRETIHSAVHLHLQPHHHPHDHHLHNLQLHHHHHGGVGGHHGQHPLHHHLNQSPTLSSDGGVSDESGDEESDERNAADLRTPTADGSSGSDSDNDTNVLHCSDDNEEDVNNDGDDDGDADSDDEDVDEADGQLRPRRRTADVAVTASSSSAASLASSSSSSSSRSPSKKASLLPLPPPTASTSTTPSSSSVQHYGSSMCYGTTPLRLMGPRFVDIPPWLRDSAADRTLHEEIISFCRWVSPSAEEKQMREDVITRISKVVEALWPSVQLRVFGSCATDIYLPTSDIDLCIMGATACSSSPIDELASALRRRCVGRVQAIATARVPIIKLVDAATGCLVDISFDVPTGPAHINLIKRYLDEESSVKPLALLLKYYLKQFGMNEPYTGGLGSYALIIMIISFLQLHKPSEVEKQHDLGVLLLGFLKLYGEEFNYFRTGLSIRDGGYYFPKAQRNWVDWQQPWLLSAEDPCFPENDISRMSYAIMDVRGCLANAYKVLVSQEPSYSAPSLLCRILLQDEKMMEQRDFVRNHYRCGLPILPHLAVAAAAHHHSTTTNWRTVDKKSRANASHVSTATTYAAKSASASNVDSVVVERRSVAIAAKGGEQQQQQQMKRDHQHHQQQRRTGDWVSLVMKNNVGAGVSNGNGVSTRAKGGKPKPHDGSTKEGGDPREDDLTWRRQPPTGAKANASASSRSSSSSSASSSARRSGGSGRWERSASSSSSSSSTPASANGERRERRNGQAPTASSSSSSSSSTASARGRSGVRHKNSANAADVTPGKRTGDETAAPRRRQTSSARRQTPPSSLMPTTVAVVTGSLPAAMIVLEPRKRTRAADNSIEDLIANNDNSGEATTMTTSGGGTIILANVGGGSDNGENEGADNGQRKARNQKQKR